MQTLDCIKTRKSIRDFKPQKIERSILEKIVGAALCAPVGMKLYDSLHLSVLATPEKTQAFTDLCRKQSKNPTADPLHGAAALVVVSGKRADMHIEYANAACLIENMLLAATDLKIGSLYVHGAINAMRGSDVEKDFHALLNLPEGFTPIGSAAFGYCDFDFSARPTPNQITKVDFIE